MPASATQLIQRTRGFLRDWPELDTLGASCTSTATTLTTTASASSLSYSANWVIQIDQEAMLVKTTSAGASITVTRGIRGTTAASHAASATVLIRPHWLDVEILDAINAGIRACFPLIYQPVLDTSLSPDSSTYEFTIPSTLPYLSRVEIQDAATMPFYSIRSWEIRRGATSKIVFWKPPVSGSTIRLHGYGPFSSVSFSESLSAQWPFQAEDLLVEYAAQRLMASGEAGRVRVDTGPIDTREQANRTGSSMTAANAVLTRWQRRLADAAMPPLPKHVVPSF